MGQNLENLRKPLYMANLDKQTRKEMSSSFPTFM